MSDNILPGEYYWIRLNNSYWEPAQYDTMGYWEVIGYEVPFLNDTNVIVGERIPKPEK